MRRRALLLVTLSLSACRPAPEASAPEASAPADAHPPVVRAALAAPAFEWVTADTPRVHLHALVGAPSADRLPALGAAAAAAHRRNLALLSEADDALRLELLFVSSREEMARIVGQPSNGHAIPEENAAVFVHRAGANPALRHELMHVLSWRRWGRPSKYWLSEGLATYAAGACAGYDVDALAAALRAEGRFVPFDVLNTRFRSADDVATYLESASLVRFLHERHGLAVVKALWQHGPARAGATTGRSMDALARDWQAHLAGVAPAAPGWEAAVRARGCE